MAHDRANDPKRVPSLGISEPKSHVKLVGKDEIGVWNKGTEDETNDITGRVKYNALGKPQHWHEEDARTKEHHTKFINNKARKEGKTPVVKIDSSK